MTPVFVDIGCLNGTRKTMSCTLSVSPKNDRLLEKSAHQMDQVSHQYHVMGKKKRLWGNTHYAANTWKRQRRAIVKPSTTPREKILVLL